MIKYHRLTFQEREEISRYLASNLSIRAISSKLCRSPATISREIKRSCWNRKFYRAISGQKYALKQKCQTSLNRKLDTNIKLREFAVHHLITKRWSPEQVAKRLKVLYPNDMDMRISHESIYSYLYVYPRSLLKKEIIANLKLHHINRRPRKKRQHSTPIQDYLSIEERPAEVADRIVPGHWEGDLVMGRNNESFIGTLVERTTRFTLLVKLNSRDATTVRKAFAKEFKKFPKELKRTLTYDQGQEMAHHKLFTKDTDITVYFAHPHSPWERGTNENTNSIIRRFYPKGTDFSKISKVKLKQTQELINDRPRKIHNFYTPNEVFHKLLR